MSEKKNKESIQEKLKEKHFEAKIVRRIVFTVFVILMLALTGVIGGGYFYIKNALKPVSEDSTETTMVDIPIGSSPTAIYWRKTESSITEKHSAIMSNSKMNQVFRLASMN